MQDFLKVQEISLNLVVTEEKIQLGLNSKHLFKTDLLNKKRLT